MSQKHIDARRTTRTTKADPTHEPKRLHKWRGRRKRYSGVTYNAKQPCKGDPNAMRARVT